MNTNILFYKAIISFYSLIFITLTHANQVELTGSIIEVPCSIDMGSRNQEIDMGVLPISQIIRDGKSPKKDLDIQLVNCFLENPNTQKKWQYLTVTFDGPHKSGLFKTDGQAKGIALQLHTKNGEVVLPGKAIAPQQLIVSENQTLNFELRVVSNNEELISGKYHSILKFKINYY